MSRVSCLPADQNVTHSPMRRNKRMARFGDKENLGNQTVTIVDGLKPSISARKRKSMGRRVSFAVRHDVHVFKDWESPPAESPPKKQLRNSPPPPPMEFDDDNDESMQLTDTFTSQQMAEIREGVEEQQKDETMELTESGGSVLADSAVVVMGTGSADHEDLTSGSMDITETETNGFIGALGMSVSMNDSTHNHSDESEGKDDEKVDSRDQNHPSQPPMSLDDLVTSTDGGEGAGEGEGEIDTSMAMSEMDFTRVAGNIILPQAQGTHDDGEKEKEKEKNRSGSPLPDTTETDMGMDMSLDHTRFSSFAPSEFTENMTMTNMSMSKFSVNSMGSNLSTSAAPEMTQKITRGLLADVAKKHEKMIIGAKGGSGSGNADMTTYGLFGGNDDGEDESEGEGEAEREPEADSFDTVFKRVLSSTSTSMGKTNLDFSEFSRLAGVRFLTNLTAAFNGSSTIPSVKLDQLGDGEAVEEACVVLPRYQNLQWGVTQLSQLTTSLSGTVEQLEKQMSISNPAIYTALTHANSDDLLSIQQQIKKLQTMENLRAHLMWYEWKKKLERAVNKAFVSSFDELENDARLIQEYENKIKELTCDIGIASMKLRLQNELKTSQNELRELQNSQERKVDVSVQQVEDLEDDFSVLESVQNWRFSGIEIENGDMNMIKFRLEFPDTNVQLIVHSDASKSILKIEAQQTEIEGSNSNDLLDFCMKSSNFADYLPSESDLKAANATLKDLPHLIGRTKLVIGRCTDLYRALHHLKMARNGIDLSVSESSNSIDLTCSNIENGSKWIVSLSNIGPHSVLGGDYSVCSVFGGVDLSSIDSMLSEVSTGFGWVERIGEVLSEWTQL